MKIDEIANAIARASVEILVPLLTSLNEQERRDFRSQIYRWYREIDSGEETSLPRKPQSGAHHAAALAVLATGNLKDVQRTQIWWGLNRDDTMVPIAFKILEARRPKWADSWLNKQIAGESFFPWALLEKLVASGICEKPTTDDYIRFLGNRFNDFQVPLVPRLKARPWLLESDVWRLFEVETSAFSMDPTNWAGHYPHAETWGTAFVDLASTGVIPREKLLDFALQGLARDLNQKMATGILRLLKALKPRAAELGDRQAILRELLASATSFVAKFGLAALKKAKPLDAEEYLRAALPVFRLSVKGNSLTLLKHARDLLEDNATPLETVVPLFEAGLTHAHPDVRDYALNWLQAQGLKALIQESNEPEELEVELDLKAVDRKWLELLDFDSQGFPGPLRFRPSAVPYLSGLNEVVPIDTLQELIDEVAAAVEDLPCGLQLERILGGLSRLCNLRPADFSVRTEALLKRITEFQSTETLRGLVAGYAGVSYLMRRLLLVWLTDSVAPVSESKYYRPLNVYPFLRARLLELTARVAKRLSAPMLCEPTHQAGWLLPEALVNRLNSATEEPGEADLIQAFLRLSPIGRASALALTQGIQAWWVEPLRWAFGGTQSPPPKAQRPEVWLAAWRARGPLAALDHVALKKLPGQARNPASFQWNPQWVGTEHKFPRFQWECAATPQVTKLGALKSLLFGGKYRQELLPTLQFQHRSETRIWESVDLQSPWVTRWLALIWPGELRGYWRQAADRILERMDIDRSSTFPNFAWLDPLFEVDRTWDELEYLILVLGLIGKDSDVAGLCVDAAIDGITDGRFHPHDFLTVIQRVYESNWVKSNRLAASFTEVARVGPLHERVVAEVVGRLLGLPLPKGGYHLLQLMLEMGQGLPAEASQKLAEISGTSKTAKLVKRLQALGEPRPLSDFRELALEGRLERAKRWSGA